MVSKNNNIIYFKIVIPIKSDVYIFIFNKHKPAKLKALKNIRVIMRELDQPNISLMRHPTDSRTILDT